MTETGVSAARTDDASRRICLVRGGGDLATGVVWRLHRCGFQVLVTELADPLTVRRTVALSSAVAAGVTSVEGLVGRRVDSITEAHGVMAQGDVAVLVSPALPDVDACAVVDARLAKRNIDSTIDDAALVVGLGPGFVAGVDCHAAIETMRGPRLGRVLWSGSPQPNTGTPGIVGGRSLQRVLRAPVSGVARWEVAIGDRVEAGALLGHVGGEELTAPFDGVVRGLIAEASSVSVGLKIGDIDPRLDVNCHEISDKALAIGGGVVEAVLTEPGNRR